jgi:membrane protein implicated in regulation of membrane protease activity
MIFLNRRKEGEDPHLDWKVRSFLAGAFLALLGMGLELNWLIWLGIAVLLAGFGLRFLRGDNTPSEQTGSEE